MIRCQTQKVKEMVLNDDHIQDNASYPDKTPGPTGASLERQPASGIRPPAPSTSNLSDDGLDEREGSDHPFQQNPPPRGRSGAGALPGGGSEVGQGSSGIEEMVTDNSEDNNEDNNAIESREEDPVNGQKGRTIPQRPRRVKRWQECSYDPAGFLNLVPTPSVLLWCVHDGQIGQLP